MAQQVREAVELELDLLETQDLNEFFPLIFKFNVCYIGAFFF